jgi:anti-sigma factor RsiW
MSCDLARRQILLLVYDELDAEERAAVAEHLRRCSGCAEALAEERRLQALLALSPPAEPPDDVLARCRIDLAAALAQEPPALPDGGIAPARSQPAAAPAPRRGRTPGRFWSEVRLAPAYAAGLLAAGFLAGWMTLGSGLEMLREVAGRAMLGSEAEAAVASVNALVADPESDRVRVSYDTLQRRSIEGSAVDPAIRRLLLATLQGSLNAGLRLDAIDALRKHAADREVREALLQAIREDRNVGARLKALEALQRVSARDAGVRETLARAVLLDDNPGVRVRAIDILGAARDPRDLPIFERLAREDPNGYIRLRAAAMADELSFAEAR